MVQKYDSLGSGWNDEKYRELGQIVHNCSNALKQPISELQRCEVFLQQLLKIISEYESISFTGNGGGSASSSSNSHQYSSAGGGGRVSSRRYRRMSSASSRNIDYNHQRSLREYCGDGHELINGHLRGTLRREMTVERAGLVQDDIINLTETLNQHQLGRNMTLYRGVSNPGFMIGDNWENMTTAEINSANAGRIFHDNGFCSTSVSQNGASDFSQSRTGAMIIIHAPADANGMFVGAYNGRENEQEVLLQRGSDFRIDSVQRDGYGNCIINATLVGRGGQ